MLQELILDKFADGYIKALDVTLGESPASIVEKKGRQMPQKEADRPFPFLSYIENGVEVKYYYQLNQSNEPVIDTIELIFPQKKEWIKYRQLQKIWQPDEPEDLEFYIERMDNGIYSFAEFDKKNHQLKRMLIKKFTE
ncbi:hypothetical protein P8825_15315 [Shouchella clausii]|uniref:hypothetical protein n=1 Tax=Shouchella clausii TaxID=79880 RepID=UPI002DBB0687|nr:hypothetical protein [Shouchella clausii]MEB5480934.1 hypothetical protein [Shouchella clausii]